MIVNGPTFHSVDYNNLGVTSAGNPAGHAALAVQGGGIFSYGNDTPLGSSTTQYLTDQAQKRDTVVYVINTNSTQAGAAMTYYYSNYPNINGVNRYPDGSNQRGQAENR